MPGAFGGSRLHEGLAAVDVLKSRGIPGKGRSPRPAKSMSLQGLDDRPSLPQRVLKLAILRGLWIELFDGLDNVSLQIRVIRTQPLDQFWYGDLGTVPDLAEGLCRGARNAAILGLQRQNKVGDGGFRIRPDLAQRL